MGVGGAGGEAQGGFGRPPGVPLGRGQVFSGSYPLEHVATGRIGCLEDADGPLLGAAVSVGDRHRTDAQGQIGPHRPATAVAPGVGQGWGGVGYGGDRHPAGGLGVVAGGDGDAGDQGRGGAHRSLVVVIDALVVDPYPVAAGRQVLEVRRRFPTGPFVGGGPVSAGKGKLGNPRRQVATRHVTKGQRGVDNGLAIVDRHELPLAAVAGRDTGTLVDLVTVSQFPGRHLQAQTAELGDGVGAVVGFREGEALVVVTRRPPDTDVVARGGTAAEDVHRPRAGATVEHHPPVAVGDQVPERAVVTIAGRLVKFAARGGTVHHQVVTTGHVAQVVAAGGQGGGAVAVVRRAVGDEVTGVAAQDAAPFADQAGVVSRSRVADRRTTHHDVRCGVVVDVVTAHMGFYRAVVETSRVGADARITVAGARVMAPFVTEGRRAAGAVD